MFTCLLNVIFCFRNVSYNPLRYFIGEVKAVFPSLDLVDLTGVKSWTPDNQLAKIFSLKKIFGFSFGKSCSNCMLFLPEIFEDIPFRYEYKSGNCHLMHYDLSGVLTKLIKLDSDFRFQLHCHFPRKCFEAHLDAEIDNSEVHNLCWENSLVMLKVVGTIGIAGLIINLLVALNIICSKKLRENISMLFVCNMSVSDFLLSLFSLCLLVYSSSHSYDQLHRITRATNWKIGFLWVLGLCGSVITSFYLTLERYLVIVYTMNPNIRICRRLAYFMILVCWLIAIFVTGYALYYKFYSQSTFCIPIRVNYSNSNSHIFKYSIFTGSSGLVFSILSFILYIHIYIFAKRSANNLGVKRESNVAKQIAFLVFSNIFFYCFPLIINGVIAVALSDPFKTINHVSLLLSITMNSFVNPFLHAFRNGRFQKVLKSRIQQFGVAL